MAALEIVFPLLIIYIVARAALQIVFPLLIVREMIPIAAQFAQIMTALFAQIMIAMTALFALIMIAMIPIVFVLFYKRDFMIYRAQQHDRWTPFIQQWNPNLNAQDIEILLLVIIIMTVYCLWFWARLIMGFVLVCLLVAVCVLELHAYCQTRPVALQGIPPGYLLWRGIYVILCYVFACVFFTMALFSLVWISLKNMLVAIVCASSILCFMGSRSTIYTYANCVHAIRWLDALEVAAHTAARPNPGGGRAGDGDGDGDG